MKNIKNFITERLENNVGYCISVGENVFTEQEINVINEIADKYGVDYDGWGSYYVYKTDLYEDFVNELKKTGFGGKTIYLYQGEEPDYEWHQIGEETI